MNLATPHSRELFQPRHFQPLLEQWRNIKRTIKFQLADLKQPKAPAQLAHKIQALWENYQKLTEIYKTVKRAQNELLEPSNSCDSLIKNTFSVSAADTTSLIAGLGLALTSFFKEESMDSSKDSTLVKSASIGLIVLSQVFSKWNDYRSMKKVKEEKALEKSLSAASEILTSYQFLIQTKNCIQSAQTLCQQARHDKKPLLKRQESTFVDINLQETGTRVLKKTGPLGSLSEKAPLLSHRVQESVCPDEPELELSEQDWGTLDTPDPFASDNEDLDLL